MFRKSLLTVLLSVSMIIPLEGITENLNTTAPESKGPVLALSPKLRAALMAEMVGVIATAQIGQKQLSLADSACKQYLPADTRQENASRTAHRRFLHKTTRVAARSTPAEPSVPHRDQVGARVRPGTSAPLDSDRR